MIKRFEIRKAVGAMAIFIVMALTWLCGYSQGKEAPALSETSGDTIVSQPVEPDLTVSLITCYPGPEVYELCGHEAIRVRGKDMDMVWNFGIFDFNQPNFIYRFVKGETDYKCAVYPFKWFLPEYEARGSRVVEQDLNLTPEETGKLVSLLEEAARPENATYRYNYVKDNCATRILTKLDASTEQTIIYPDSVRYGTFREEMKAYHKGYPWYQFGIDLALGSGLDYPLTSREEMFVPVEMMKNISEAKFSDGRPLVKATRVLNEGREKSTLPDTPWYAGPLFWSWFMAFLVFGVVIWDLSNNRVLKPLYMLWFTITGLAGCLIAFLVFISVHEATSPNILILWLNPFQFLLVAGIIFKRLEILAVVFAWYNLIVVGILIIISPFLTQSLNPAFYPLMIATAALGYGYAILHVKKKLKK